MLRKADLKLNLATEMGQMLEELKSGEHSMNRVKAKRGHQDGQHREIVSSNNHY